MRRCRQHCWRWCWCWCWYYCYCYCYYYWWWFLAGRSLASGRSPRRGRPKSLSIRLLLQLVGVGAFAGAAVGSFYLNGSFTHTEEGGRTVTYSGPEALIVAWQQLGTLSSDVSAAASQVR